MWNTRRIVFSPHGPHNVRDVLATHILKQTGSYEQASYAIQDTPEMVAKHYGRFLVEHKPQLPGGGGAPPASARSRPEGQPAAPESPAQP